MVAHPHDDDAMKSRVRLPVASAVQPMAGRLAAGGWDRTGAAKLGKGGFGADPIGIVTNQDQHLGCRASGDAMSFHHGRRAGCRQRIEMTIMGLDLGIERQPAPREGAQGGFGRGCR